MKRVSLLIMGCLFFSSVLLAQMNEPVRWSFSSKKISDRTFELHFTAQIEEPWHIYAQDMNAELGFPTAFNFNKNPLIELEGKPEAQKPATEKVVGGIALKYYKDQVEFVQVVKVKGDTKVNVNGKIDYMVCTDSHCLPPSARRFSLSLE